MFWGDEEVFHGWILYMRMVARVVLQGRIILDLMIPRCYDSQLPVLMLFRDTMAVLEMSVMEITAKDRLEPSHENRNVKMEARNISENISSPI